MKIALFGGTFDPPHCAHRRVAELVLEEFGMDRVWWIPSKEPPHKARGSTTPFEHRLAMVRLATWGHPAFCVKDLERMRPGPSYTVDTVKAVLEANAQDAFWLLIGEDSLQQFHLWHAPEHIAALLPLIVYRRAEVSPRTALLPYLEARVQYGTVPPIRGAGTAIRALVAHNKDFSDLVCERVCTYISEYGLYRSSKRP